MELAERILTATYKVRRGLSVVRCILLRAYELEDAEKILKEQGAWDAASETERRHLRQAHVYYNRLEATKDDRLALEECQPMARALFGEELEQALEKLIHQAWIVNVFASTAETKDAELQADIFDALRERYPKPEKNKMDQTIAAQVKTIEDVCLPVLRLENEKRKGSIRLSERARASRAPVSGGS